MMKEQDIRLHINEKYGCREIFKLLRYNIESKCKDSKVIAITSCNEHEGKSTLATHTAISFAKSGKRTLLVETDLKGEELPEIVSEVSKKKGLSEYLRQKCKLSEVVNTTNVENLDLVLGGEKQRNLTELLESAVYDDFLEKLKEEYDYIFLDTPAITNTVDGIVVGKKSDAVILVVQQGKVKYKVAKRVLGQLEANGCTIGGLVINKAAVREKDSYKMNYAE